MNPQALFDQTVSRIHPVSPEAVNKAYERLDNLTKPRRSLGYLEELAARLVAVTGQARPDVGKKRIFVFVGDHGVVEEGVSAYPSEVTALMVKNFLGGGAAINVLARRAGAGIEVIDIGMKEDPGAAPALIRNNIKRGAANIARGPAMTREEVFGAMAVGIQRATLAVQEQVVLLGTGEMGIGNSTPAAALLAAFLNLPVSQVVGRGTGLDDKGLQVKTRVIEKALAVNRGNCAGPVETLAALGGLELAGICGLCLGAAAHSRPVVVDGFISSASALAAMRICPAVKDYLFFAHMSAEAGHRQFFTSEGLRPIVDLGMRLGEGTGAAIAMQILEDAVAITNEMATFADIGITPGA